MKVVAMGIMPSLFDSTHGRDSLQTALHSLFSDKHQLGIKTLSPQDQHYRCFYDNSYGYDGDIEVCGGWSYHNVSVLMMVFTRDLNGYGLLEV